MMAKHMSAETIAKALGGRKAGQGWSARCPAHVDREPSLAIRDTDEGKVLVRCFAGCDQQRVISALRARGLWSKRGLRSAAWAPRRKPIELAPARDEAERTKWALAIWQSATPVPGTPVAAYLASRGIHLPASDALRFHPGLKHPSGGLWPVMVALVTTGIDGTPIAIHRTFLASDGCGKAPVDPQKMMLGPCRGGAVRLAEAGDVLMVGEGIETCLAAMQATGRPGWAALSTSGLMSLQLPVRIEDVVVLADGDDPGEAAAVQCARRWAREGRRVRIARPPRGADFADMLGGALPSTGEASS